MQISINEKKPIGNAILTCFNENQAKDRFDRGAEAAKAVIAALNGESVDPIIDITKPEIVGIDPIITKEVLDANPNRQPEWGG